MHSVTVFVILGVCVVDVQGFCARDYDFVRWQPQSVIQRSIDADIIVYAEIIDSPCKNPRKPSTTPVPPTTQVIMDKISFNYTSANSTGNSTSNVTTTQAPTTTALPTTTQIPTTIATTVPLNESVSLPGHNCSSQPYNASLKIHCVIKGGQLPEYIHIKGLGLGKEMCLSDYWNETVHEYHAYHRQNYTFFLKRKHDHVPEEDSFSLHIMNLQPAMVEIHNASTDLPPIFKVAGRHAHVAMGVWRNRTDPICKPYSAASTLNVISVAMAMALSFLAMTSF